MQRMRVAVRLRGGRVRPFLLEPSGSPPRFDYYNLSRGECTEAVVTILRHTRLAPSR